MGTGVCGAAREPSVGGGGQVIVIYRLPSALSTSA